MVLWGNRCSVTSMKVFLPLWETTGFIYQHRTVDGARQKLLFLPSCHLSELLYLCVYLTLIQRDLSVHIYSRHFLCRFMGLFHCCAVQNSVKWKLTSVEVKRESVNASCFMDRRCRLVAPCVFYNDLPPSKNESEQPGVRTTVDSPLCRTLSSINRGSAVICIIFSRVLKVFWVMYKCSPVNSAQTFLNIWWMMSSINPSIRDEPSPGWHSFGSFPSAVLHASSSAAFVSGTVSISHQFIRTMKILHVSLWLRSFQFPPTLSLHNWFRDDLW